MSHRSQVNNLIMSVNSSAKPVGTDSVVCGIVTNATRYFLVLSGLLLCFPLLCAAGELQQYVEVGGKTILLGSSIEPSMSSSHISAPAGQYVRLMPGTHIRQGDNLTINIISKDHHEALLASQRENKRQKTIAAIKQHKQSLPAEPLRLFYFSGPGGDNTAGHKLNPQYQAAKASLSPRVHVPGIKLIMITERFQLKYGLSQQYFPDLTRKLQLSKSWGNRPENIKVMLS